MVSVSVGVRRTLGSPRVLPAPFTLRPRRVEAPRSRTGAFLVHVGHHDVAKNATSAAPDQRPHPRPRNMLDKVCAMTGCTWKLDTEGKSPVLSIMAKK